MKHLRRARWPRPGARALSCGAMVLALACATPGTAVKPSRAAEERVLARARAHEAREVFEVRLNPAGCDAPPFEVRLDGVWQRVFLEPDDPAGLVGILTDRLESERTEEGGPTMVRIRGRLLAKVRVAPNRAPYPILVILGECRDDACGAEAGPDETPEGERR